MRATTIWGALALAAAHAPSAAAQTSSTGPYYAAPSWDQQLAPSSRFILLTNWQSQAFLDREDGLVWQVAVSYEQYAYSDARLYCENSSTGGRFGWRLPTAAEISRTFVVPMATPNPAYSGSLSPGLPVQPPYNPYYAYFLWTSTPTSFGANSSTVFLGIQEGNVNINEPVGYVAFAANVACVQSPVSSPAD